MAINKHMMHNSTNRGSLQVLSNYNTIKRKNKLETKTDLRTWKHVAVSILCSVFAIFTSSRFFLISFIVTECLEKMKPKCCIEIMYGLKKY